MMLLSCRHHFTLWTFIATIIIIILVQLVDHGQCQLRPISLPGIFSAIRYQNTACDGENEETGLCLYESECLNRKGAVIGRCANGFAACCSFKFTCGGETNQNETFFVNKQYPGYENETNTCQVTIKKLENICQLRLDFEEFSMSQPDENGFCTTDSFMVRTTVGERLPIICGENAGQHIYIDMGQGSKNPVVLSIVTNGARVLRKWKIKINMITCNSLDMAPSGCLQYYRSATDVIRSFNFGPKLEYRARYLANLRYTTCIRTEENFCAIKWETENPGMFMFGAPFEGKDNEYSDCSQSFPFFGMQGKTEDSEPVINSTATQMTLYGLNDNQETVSPSVTTMTPSTVTENSLIMAENREDNMSEKNNPTLDKDSLYIHRCQNGASGVQCNFDDFIGIDQGSIEGTGQGEDRFCGARLLEHDFIISRSKPFQLRVRSNGDHFSNAINSQAGFSLKYTQLPCVI
ncbi:uncharacterized protein LOC124494186 [Dermatophagoides farinae]|uniref:CUB domain-containing protein n=2 Tax=Dermatophagoides farinae TaxID=6954 RepID=A0A922KVQ9_DERFA|nr:uncharacterized protein LOC124494186 [Dermatophagoides farinae]KAH9497009.1 hypothetical protein DERF_013027 [Dermatophagoides farinae]